MEATRTLGVPTVLFCMLQFLSPSSFFSPLLLCWLDVEYLGVFSALRKRNAERYVYCIFLESNVFLCLCNLFFFPLTSAFLVFKLVYWVGHCPLFCGGKNSLLETKLTFPTLFSSSFLPALCSFTPSIATLSAPAFQPPLCWPHSQNLCHWDYCMFILILKYKMTSEFCSFKPNLSKQLTFLWKKKNQKKHQELHPQK